MGRIISFIRHIRVNPVRYETVSENIKGTKIILEGLRDDWSEEMIVDLRKELFLLVPIDIGKLSSRFKSEVKVNLKCDEYPNKSGELQDKLLKYYHARLYGELFEDGSGKLELELRLNRKNTVEEIGIKYERKILMNEFNYNCGPVVFEAYAFLRDMRLYRGFELNKDELTKLLDAYGGIKIYRDSFRVKPYGDPDNDWLNLNLKRVQSPEYRLATHQVIGGVMISRDNNPGLQDVLSRENLYDTQEFKDLAAFVNSVFEFYTYASFVEMRSKKKEDRDTREELYSKIVEGSSEIHSEIKRGLKKIEEKTANIEKAMIQTNDNEFKNNETQIQKAKTEIGSLIDDVKTDFNKINELAYKLKNEAVVVTQRIKDTDKFKEREMQIYRNIASLGISAAQFGHETAKLILNSVLTVRSINRFDEIKKIINDDLRSEFVCLEHYLNSANQKADFFRGYLMREKQENKENIDIVHIFKEVANSFDKSFKEINVNIEIEDQTQGDSKITGYYGDIESIVTNILTNVYKALTQGIGEEKLFKINFQVKNSHLIVNTINSGKPIELEDRLRIFDPLFSTHKHGTGLGLPIIEDTLKTYGGSIRLLEDYPLTKFEIQIPLR